MSASNKKHISRIPFHTFRLNSMNRPEDKIYCQHCGKLLVDFTEDRFNNIWVGPKKVSTGPNEFIILEDRKNRGFKTQYPFYESPDERWAILGRTLSGKTYYRKICWDCFFKLLAETEDIPKRARKSKWYKKILDGNPTPPVATTSPSKYFKLLFDITDEELNHERAKFDTASKESFIRRYGKEDGLKKFQTYCERQAYTASTEYFIKDKGMTPLEAQKFNVGRAVTKKNLIHRYGKEDGLRRWKEYCDRQSYAGNKLEYFIEKYGEEDGLKAYKRVCSEKILSKLGFIRKYGETLGIQKWDEYQNKIKNTAARGYSVISQKLFDQISRHADLDMSKMHYATHNGEIEIDAFNQNLGISQYLIRPDFVMDNKIIEFYGDYWHGNPKIYSADDLHESQMPYKDIWARDAERIEALKTLGYQVHIVWESDYYNDPDKVLQECINFLKS